MDSKTCLTQQHFVHYTISYTRFGAKSTLCSDKPKIV